MKPTTQNRYTDKIHSVIDAIYQHLDQPLSLDDLAAIACLSPYHWHRIYMSITGETHHQTLIRLRLHRAAMQLKQGQSTARVARQAHMSLDHFSRTFKDHYQLSPTQYRQAHLKDEPRLSHSIYQQYQHSLGHLDTDITLKNMMAFDFFEYRVTGPMSGLGAAFQKIIAWASQHDIHTHIDQTFTRYWRCDPNAVEPAMMEWSACIAFQPGTALPELPSFLTRQHQPDQSMAVLIHQGPYTDLEMAYRYVFWRLSHQSFPETYHAPIIERYLNDPITTPAKDLLTEIAVPVQPK